MTLVEALKEKPVNMEIKLVGHSKVDGWERDDWKGILKYNGRTMDFEFHTGVGLRGKTPTVADVLYCLLSDSRAGEMEFDEFCSEFGYSEDSISAKETWEQCYQISWKMGGLLQEDYDFFMENNKH